MNINGVMLADYLTISPDGVVFVGRGGIRFTSKDSYPAPLGLQLLVSVDLGEDYPAGETFGMQVTVEFVEDDSVVAHLVAEVQPDNSTSDGWGAIALIPVPLTDVPLPKAGRYLTRVRLADGGSEQVVKFAAT